MSTRHAFALSSCVCLAACGGSSGGGVIVDVFPKTELRIHDDSTGGGHGDGLAASLFLGLDMVAERPGRAGLAFSDTGLMADLAFKARSHLQTAALMAAAGADPRGSGYIRRLAAQSTAPIDQNSDGSNLDETLDLEMRRLAQLAGTSLPPDLRPIMLPWVRGSADYLAAPAVPAQIMPTRIVSKAEVDTAQLGQAMLARVLRAGYLLQRNRGSAPGSNPADGTEGLLLLQQVIAAEETLFASLFMDGATVSGFTFPADYDPTKEQPRWLPRRLLVRSDAQRPAEVASYAPADRASDLLALASMMRAGGELAWLASDNNPNPNLRDLFRGNPFGPLPGSTGGSGGSGGSSSLVTWEDGVSAILARDCVGCHSGPFASGDFRCDTYANTLAGGGKSGPGSANPIVVRGEPGKSLLVKILGASPPAGFIRMPDGGPYLSAQDVALIARWIEDGARSAPPGPPRIGLDLAEVMYKNLVHFHLDPASGALRSRHEGDSGLALATSRSTGAALQALGSLAHLEGSLADFKQHVAQIAAFASQHLVDAQGRVYRDYDLAAGQPGPLGDLADQAQLLSGLAIAGEILLDQDLSDRAVALGEAMLADFRPTAAGLFATSRGRDAAVYTPQILAALSDALRHLVALAVPGAVEIHDSTFAQLRPALVFSEVAGQGEILGDGLADSDGDGVPEPVFAGGAFGRAPVFAGEVRIGLDPPVDDSGPLTWSRHVLPLFRNKCGRCHFDGAKQGGYQMDTPTLLQTAGDSRTTLPFVVPGDPESSLLYRKLVDRNPTIGAQMPLQTPTLSETGKALIRSWIEAGASFR